MERFAPVPLHGMEMLAGSPEELSDTNGVDRNVGRLGRSQVLPQAIPRALSTYNVLAS